LGFCHYLLDPFRSLSLVYPLQVHTFVGLQTG
jgi:hypothetical protein